MKVQTQLLGNDHERTDAHIGPLIQFLVYLAVVCAASFWGMKVLLHWFQEQPVPLANNVPHPNAPDRVIPPEPRLEGPKRDGILLPVHLEGFENASQFLTSQNYHDLHARELKELSTYGWIDQQNADKQKNVVHIPIDAAIELTLKKGLPTAEKKR